MKNLNYDELPYVSDELIETLKEVFKDSVKNLKTAEDLYIARGQQSVIDFLDTVRINQQETGE